MKRNRRITALLIAMLAASLLTGCGNKVEESATESSVAESAESPAQESTSPESSADAVSTEVAEDAESMSDPDDGSETMEAVDASEASSEDDAGDSEMTEEITGEIPDHADQKIAILFSGPVADGGWNWDGYTEIQELAGEYGFAWDYAEEVSDENAADVARRFAEEGYGLILNNESYQSGIMQEVALEYPDVVFGCVNGQTASSNLVSVTGDGWQHYDLAGVLAGSMTESGKIGIITYATDSNAAVLMKKAIEAGAESAGKEIRITHKATESFSDAEAGIKIAESLMKDGCDVIFCDSGSVNDAVYEAVTANGCYAIASELDRNAVSEDRMLASAVSSSSQLVRILTEGYLNGELPSSEEVCVYGIAEGAEDLVINPVLADTLDKDVLAALDEEREKILAGEITAPKD